MLFKKTTNSWLLRPLSTTILCRWMKSVFSASSSRRSFNKDSMTSLSTKSYTRDSSNWILSWSWFEKVSTNPIKPKHTNVEMINNTPMGNVNALRNQIILYPTLTLKVSILTYAILGSIRRTSSTCYSPAAILTSIASSLYCILYNRCSTFAIFSHCFYKWNFTPSNLFF